MPNTTSGAPGFREHPLTRLTLGPQSRCETQPGAFEGRVSTLEGGAPAVRAAGLAPRGPDACRHTFAPWAIESGVRLPYLATIMGTSVREIEDTYFRWLQRTDEQLLAMLDGYDAAIG